jgi:SHS2 domain-containing protein
MHPAVPPAPRTACTAALHCPASPLPCRQYEAEGHDLQSLLFNFLDELLFAFSTEFFVAKQLRVTALDRDNWRIQAEG